MYNLLNCVCNVVLDLKAQKTKQEEEVLKKQLEDALQEVRSDLKFAENAI